MGDKLGAKEQMLMMAIKPFVPKIKGALTKASIDFSEYLKSLPLQDGETHITAFAHIQDGIMFLVIGAFRDKTYVRFIEAKQLDEWIFSLITNAING